MHIAKSWLAIALAGIALPVLAATPSPPPSGSDGFNIARLEQIQSETLLLEAQAQRTKAELAAQGGGSPDTSSPSPSSTPSVVPVGNSLPRVTQIAGAGSALSARLLMTDGSQSDVITGQTLSGSGLTITRITSRGVTARRQDGGLLTLPMAE
ncbi:type IV pilus biogenesis protein PilP [Scandinavium goeteborgense]|uniref:type IV pilus biogenesis protein PilP n=1 Tax=Scandinavium goeteborgense TaxID=1851514 RepID=UPI003828F456